MLNFKGKFLLSIENGGIINFISDELSISKRQVKSILKEYGKI
jgi:hypothetical protein